MDYVEYDYIDNQLISESLGWPVEKLKQLYKDDCYGLASELVAGFMDSGVLAAVVTFKNGHSLDISINDYYNNEVKTYAFHSVVMLGNCLIDLLHSDRYISTSRYIKELKNLNPDLRLDTIMTEQWYDYDGQLVDLSIDILEVYY